MDSPSKQISEMVRTGAYFEESRAWYQLKYIGPIAERTFFLIIAILAGLIAFFAFLAVMMFLPLTDKRAVIVPNDRIDDAIPSLVRLRPKDMSMSTALMRFFAASYVIKRESYTDESYETNMNFVKVQSDPTTFAKYQAQYDRSNRQSPAAILNNVGERKVMLKSVNINSYSNPMTATVTFSTDVTGYTEALHADWTAILQFYYTDLVVTQATDPTTHKPTVKTQDPQFQVVSYELKQTP